MNRTRMVKASVDCPCYHCTGDLEARSGWIAVAIAEGRAVRAEALRRRDAEREAFRAVGLRVDG